VNLSQSLISQESEYSASECSPLCKPKDKDLKEMNMLGDDLRDLKLKVFSSGKKNHSPEKSQFERRASCLNNESKNLEVPNFKIKDSTSQIDDSSDSSKIEESDVSMEEVNQKEDDQITKRQSISIIKPQFIIKKRKMAGAKLSMPTESSQELSKGDSTNKEELVRTDVRARSLKKIKFTTPIRHIITKSATKRREKSQNVKQISFKERKTSLPILQKCDSQKIIPSYFKASLKQIPRMGNLKNSIKGNNRGEESKTR